MLTLSGSWLYTRVHHRKIILMKWTLLTSDPHTSPIQTHFSSKKSFNINETRVLWPRCILLIHSSHSSRNSDWTVNGCDYDLLSESGAGSDGWRCVWCAKPAVVGREWSLAKWPAFQTDLISSAYQEPLDHSVGFSFPNLSTCSHKDPAAGSDTRKCM